MVNKLDNPKDKRKFIRISMKEKNITELDKIIEEMNKDNQFAKVDRPTVVEGLVELFIEKYKAMKKGDKKK